MDGGLFEDKIRKKLESMEVKTNEADWLRFHAKKINSKKRGNFFFSRNIFKIAASIGLVGLVFLSVAQFVTYNNYKKQIEIIKSENIKLQKKQKYFESKILSLTIENTRLEEAQQLLLLKTKAAKQANYNNKTQKRKKIVRIKKVVLADTTTVTEPKTTFFGKVKNLFKGLFKGKKPKNKEGVIVKDSLTIVEEDDSLIMNPKPIIKADSVKIK